MFIPIIVIGAGPAGMIAAVQAGRHGGKAALLDVNPSLGRKLLITGSGRANLTNQRVNAGRYSCADPAWIETVLSHFGHDDLIRFFDSIGVLTYATDDGWTYPISDSAHSVVAAFQSALDTAGVEFIPDCHITAIRKTKKGFELTREGGEPIQCSQLLVSAGGMAYPALGSKGELFPSIEQMGHTVLPLVPALGPVTADMHLYQRVQGQRLDAHVELFAGDKLLAQTTGNLIFTQWGFNGPAVMDLSHWVARRADAKNLRMVMNFLPHNEEQVRGLAKAHRKEPIPLAVIPGSSIPPKLTAFFMEQSHLPAEATLASTSDAQLEKLFNWITRFPVQITGVRDFEYCQISAGGVPVTEVDPNTLQSRLVPGLFMAGETLDVVGPCGGNNLQFAFSSGAIAGINMAEALSEARK